jgi:hypothetical protein
MHLVRENNIYHRFGRGHRYIDPGMSMMFHYWNNSHHSSMGHWDSLNCIKIKNVKIHVNYKRGLRDLDT